MSNLIRSVRWRHHGVILGIFSILSLLITWPLIRDFSSAIPSDGLDARHNLWVIWHLKEALLGQQPFYHLDLLYFPEGVSLLTHSMGPVLALLSLPFQFIGPEAAYNGALLTGLVLTGWFMYLLLQEMGFADLISLWGGALFLLAPIHLAGVYGHIDKVFLGLAPLALLCLMRATKRERPLLWSFLTALVLFLTLQHNGYQLILAGMLLAFSAPVLLWQATNEQRPKVLKRIILTGALAAAFVGPQLLLINQLSQGPLYSIDKSNQSLLFQPDLIEFFLPSGFHWFFGPAVLDIVGLPQQVETAVSLSLIALFFLLWGVYKRPRQVVPWALLCLTFFVLSLGPSLKLLGERYFSLPYDLLIQLPGFGFWRTPGRFIMMGQLGLIIGGSYGLEAMLANRPGRRSLVAVLLILGLTLLEGYPRPWPQERLPQEPAFYQALAQETEQYGVLDLPIRPTEFGWETAYASYYQMLQITHGKGIASGYISRVPQINPTLPCLYPTPVGSELDFTVNGEPTNCFDTLETRLAENGFRYVVWHRPEAWPYWGYTAESAGYAEAETIVQNTFGDRDPDYVDEAVLVYAVAPNRRPLPTEMGPRKNWYANEGDLRWAKSPAWVFISSPIEQEAELEIVLAMMFTPTGGYHIGFSGTLTVRLDNQIVFQQLVNADEQVAIPLFLSKGTHLVELELEAGSFQPTDYDPATIDRRQLSFATRAINLRLLP